jgi:hypothetical protein
MREASLLLEELSHPAIVEGAREADSTQGSGLKGVWPSLSRATTRARSALTCCSKSRRRPMA